LCADIPNASWVVLTDEPGDFAGLPVRAIQHAPTGPMAIDYLEHDYLKHGPSPGAGRAAAAYHDKRFALLAALEDFDTAIYIDADSRIEKLRRLGAFPAGLAVLPVVRATVAEHLNVWGSWRLPAFIELARHLTGDPAILQTARWCHESLVAVTKDGRESRFFEAWGVGAEFLKSRGLHSGEGGVIGLAAACAAWNVNYDTLARLARVVHHEGGGPKKD